MLYTDAHDGAVPDDEHLLNMAEKRQLLNIMPNGHKVTTWSNIGGTVAYTSNPQSLQTLKNVLTAYKKLKSA